MPTTSPTVKKARGLLEDRRDELKSELDQIEQALSNLGTGAKPSTGKRSPGRPRKSSATRRSGGKQRRSRKGGTRADHALKLVTQTPGMSASEIADALGIKPNYVYRVMGELVDDGKVQKRGKGFFPTGAAASSPAKGSSSSSPKKSGPTTSTPSVTEQATKK